ncbi:ABC transporter substrate-binding protein [Streptomyces phaeolivaceus]|uniref:ABC transporter substrate-binding protein n=1 Tax=Streptomyces phaeolivaceus TaxID=2653200 RepID=A0A5P8KGG0_9ACTN|nr:substrate-binding protein [Streptomyces phaeolivaceus]QFR01718.1 ABC transporter substrate-binding protein [Streptomyces phaeolivaceus]
MAALVLPAEEWTAASPVTTFGLFGAGTGAGWLFDAVCDRVAVGAAVRMAAPLGGQGADTVEIIGRIAVVRPPSPVREHARGRAGPGGRIEIVHDQPWRGRIKLRFDADRGGTRVRLFAELDEVGLEWLMRRRGLPTGRASSPNPRLGLLTSKSGPASLFGGATDHMATLAVEEINAEGGVRGRPVELLVGDDATDPAVGVAEAWRLVRAGCRTILVAGTSATFFAVSRTLADTEVLLVQPQMNEGGGAGPLRVQLGERPADQLAAAAGPLMRAVGAKRWFLAGNDYCWPRSTHEAARRILPRSGAQLVGERFAALGTSDFTELIESVTASGADIVLSTFVGADAAAFERQCFAMGLRERCVTLAPAMDESTLEHVGADAAPGLYAVSGYVEQLASSDNAGLLYRYREAFGRWASPLSTLSESVFEAVHIWWSAARRVGADEPRLIAAAMRDGSFELPRGTVTLDDSGRVAQHLFVSEATGAGLRPASL